MQIRFKNIFVMLYLVDSYRLKIHMRAKMNTFFIFLIPRSLLQIYYSFVYPNSSFFFLFWWYEVYLTMKSIWRTLKAARYSYDYQRLNDWIWHSWWRERENRICVKYIYWHSDAEHLSKITLICRTLPKELHRKPEIPCLVFVRLI